MAADKHGNARQREADRLDLELFRVMTAAERIANDAGDGFSFAQYSLQEGQIRLPSWLGDEAFHASHRSNLLRKDPVHYDQFGWAEPPDLPYVWPKEEAPSSKGITP